jgi:hypothetical protein
MINRFVMHRHDWVKILKNSSLFFVMMLLFAARVASAHQPRIVENDTVIIKYPEVSQAFYGELKGSPTEFRIQSNRDFNLYVGLLVPDIANIRKDISAEVYRVENGNLESIALLDGNDFVWTPFFEEYVQDKYFRGPEYKADDSSDEGLRGRPVSAGDYLIRVFSSSNIGKYTLVTGFIEEFPFKEILKASITVPRLKAQFFGYSIFEILSLPYMWGYLLVIYTFAFIAGFIYWLVLRKFAKNSVRKLNKNIGKFDRLFRFAIGLGLFLWAVATSWSPILFFFSGFAFFEAIFSWCGLYAALGKNSCPL